MKDMRPDLLYTLSQRPELKIQPNDRLKIIVNSRDPDLAVPFNVGAYGYQLGSDGQVSSASNLPQQESGYLVDSQGRIEFPILGMIRVDGMTRQEIASLIKDRLREERYISDAHVTVDVLNFKITVIGEVNGGGVQTVPEGRITLFDAIIRAGGVSTNAMMGEIVVIREDRRGYRFMYNDLRTVAVFNSPSYFLQQNDIVYVKPKTAPMTERETRTWQWFGNIMSLTSSIVTIVLLVNYFK
jgi:polysaccharide export outer membrane protein